MTEFLKQYYKTIIAITLIIIGVVTLVFWEGWGRKTIMYENIVVAAVDIPQGAKITKSQLISKAVAKDTIIKGAIRENDVPEIINKVTKQLIPENGQISKSFLYVDDFYIGKGESIFKIPAHWINSRSASIRRGDFLEIFANNETLGTYRVAFVKDAEEREVTSSQNQLYSEALERTDATGIINNIEIITTLEKYNALKDIVHGTNEQEGQRFLITQVERKI